MNLSTASLYLSFVLIASSAVVHAAPVYLNDANITVALGPSMASEPFANRTTAASLASVIDAPSAFASEFHNQSTHVWVSGGTLEFVFNFGIEFDLREFHFWNYHSEGYDVDNIDLTFRDTAMNVVGSIVGVTPTLGNETGSDGSPIVAEDIALAFPSRVQFVTAILSGSNGQVDFNNIGFTGEVSPSAVPEPASCMLIAFGALFLLAKKTRGNRRVLYR